MTFAAPLFLIAALAGLIPVVLHMINRQKVKDLPFPTLFFLRTSVEKTRRRKRIQDLFLMLVRIAVLVLIALGLARPTLTNLASLFGGGATSAVAIVLDNSASMGMIDQERRRFDTALNAAGQIVQELKDGDQIGLFIPCGPVFPEQDKLERTPEKTRQMLGQVKVANERADLGAKIQQARQLVSKATATNKVVYVITDMQTVSLEAIQKEAEAGAEGAADAAEPLTEEQQQLRKTPVVFVDVNRAPRPNCAVQKVTLETSVPVAGVPIKATAEVLNSSNVLQPRFLELYMDGAKEATSPVLSLQPGAAASHDFVFTVARGGLHRGEIRLAGEDGSKLDDRRYFTLEVDQGIPVALVKAQRHEISYLEDTFYLEQALSPGRAGAWALRVAPLTAADLAAENLSAYRVIYCVNLPAPSGDVAQKLRGFVENGGSLVWVCGDNVAPDAYNQMNQAAGGGLLPATLLEVRAPAAQDDRTTWRIGFFDKKHAGIGHLAEPATLYRSVLINKHVRMDTGGVTDAAVLARLDDGEPLLVERPVQKGKVLMLGTTVHVGLGGGATVGWTNLPLKNIFLPMFARLTYHLSGAEQVRHEGLAGAPLVLQLDPQSRTNEVEVQPPTGETLRLSTTQGEGAAAQEFRYPETHEVGVYLLRLRDAAKPTQIAYSVNLDPEEASEAKVGQEEMQDRLGATPAVFAENPDDLSSTFKWLREGKSLWGTFLTGVLIALVFETLISNRLTPKQDEEQVLQHQPRAWRRRQKAAAAKGA